MTDLRARIARKIMERAVAQEPGVWRVPVGDFTDEDLNKFGFLDFADAAIAEAFKWMPIEMAPTNETVLVNDRPYMFTAYYSTYLPGWTDGTDDDCGGTNIFYPTHWMPLPPPPAEGGK